LLHRQGGVYYYEDRETRKQLSLGTKDKAEAIRLFHAHNEAHQNSILNGQTKSLGCIWTPAIRNSRNVRGGSFDELVKTKQGNNRLRWERAVVDEAFDSDKTSRRRVVASSGFRS